MMGTKSAFQKLKMDSNRYAVDRGMCPPLGYLKLLFVVDYWGILRYRLLEHCQESGNLLCIPLKWLIFS